MVYSFSRPGDLMDLNEIEAEADKLTGLMLLACEAETAHLLSKLDGLHHLAGIKATVAFRKEREAEDSGRLAAYQLGVPVPTRSPGGFEDGKAKHNEPEPGRCQVTEFDVGTQRNCLLSAGHQPAGRHVWGPWRPVPEEEPTKPAVDRLHELVSYLIACSERGHRLNETHPERDLRHEVAASKAYDDAATKLQEILSEGGL